MVYGYTVEPHKPDPLVLIADKALEQFAAATVPGAWLVDIIPACRSPPAYVFVWIARLNTDSEIYPWVDARYWMEENWS
jgi:hypothetical protein